MSDRDVVVLSAVRSAIGAFGGGLSDIEPHELAGTVMKEAVTRSGADPARINYVTVGNCIPTDEALPLRRPGRGRSRPACRWSRWRCR